MASILQAAAAPDGPMVLKFYKEFVIDGPAGETLRRMVRLAARCELAAALQRTRSIRMVIASFDALCAKRLRSKGMLGFHDVKLLMGEWAHNEQARLRREAVDFRLDSRIHHWLLDEFQDTSRADWNGLQPLIDEAATNDENSVFIVGDRKQAIYAWRGGDVSLFDEIILQYGGNLDIESMAESWRSCPEVLHLVNQVCGDKATAKELFGKAADRWDWQDHFPAEPLGRSEKAGEARVEVVGDWDERLERMAEILTELGIGQRAMTCGILLRGNKQARDVTDFLRNRGFDVIEEGRREPAKDNPVGIVIAHLLEWLADPADAFSRAVIEMSPVSGSLQACHGSSWPAIWEGLTLAISEDGFAETIAAVIRPCSVEWSAFGQRRAGDLLAALAALDTQGGVSPQEAADWIRRLEIPQNPGIAAVQVMTIHKAKGLGFDVVILPEVPDETVPQPQYFEVADGPGWLTQTPPKWARALIPEMSDAELRWAADQQYESFCLLYVALTRAKRGLYLLLDAPSKTRDPQKASLANWVVRSLGGDFQPGTLHQTGMPDWPHTIPMRAPEAPKRAPQAPGPGIARRETHTPTNAKAKSHSPVHSPSGMRFGSQVHEILEHISWLDKTAPRLPDGEAGAAVARLLENPALHKIFVKDGRAVQLFREQHVDAIIDGRHITGIIDRLHLHQDSSGRIGKVEVMDFKTDAVKSPAELVERYSGQMECYRKFMQAIYPEANVSCRLVSVNHASAVDF
jgi:ATP-dependent helicase/nuclease subunit A